MLYFWLTWVAVAYCAGYLCACRDARRDQQITVNYAGMENLTAQQIARAAILSGVRAGKCSR